MDERCIDDGLMLTTIVYLTLKVGHKKYGLQQQHQQPVDKFDLHKFDTIVDKIQWHRGLDYI